MKKLLLSIAVFALSIGLLQAQSIDEIVAKNIKAIGGAARLRTVKSMVTESTIKVQGLEIENVSTILIGKSVRSDSKIMNDVMIQSYDGTTAWSITPVSMSGSGEAQEMPEELSKSLISQVDPFPLLDYAKKGTKLTLLPSEKVKDKDAYHLNITPKKGAEYEVWIDVASGLMSKMKTIQNGQVVEIVFTSHKVIEGINFAIAMEISNPAAGIITVDTKTVKLNTEIDESIFKMPTKKS